MTCDRNVVFETISSQIRVDEIPRHWIAISMVLLLDDAAKLKRTRGLQRFVDPYFFS